MNHRTFDSLRNLLGLAGSIASMLSGCGGAPASSGAADEAIDQEEEELYVLTTNLWPPAPSGSKTLSVCFEEPGFATERQWIRDGVNASWGAPSGWSPNTTDVKTLIFTGWNTCGSGGANLRIHLQDTIASFTQGLGTAINNVPSGINLTTFLFIPDCGKGWTRDKCVKTLAVHEFGHALGFSHEHNRDDRTSDCTATKQGQNGNVKIGAFDMQSVMNECNPVWYNGGALSPTDIYGLQRYYGPYFDWDGSATLKTYNTEYLNPDGRPIRSGTYDQCRGGNELLVGMDQRDGTKTIQCRAMFGTWAGDIAGRRIGYSNSGLISNGAATCPFGFAAFGVDFNTGIIKCGSVANYNGTSYASGGGDYNHFLFETSVHEIHACPTGVIQGANVKWPNPPKPGQVGFNFNCVNPG